jgi:hypothetical protein
MIKLEVDEGYAMDYLSILEIKLKKNTQQTLTEACVSCYKNIEKEIGKNKFLEIYNSEEFQKLKIANEKTFDAVELARYGETTAKHVDDCNMERFHCKKAIMEKFFPQLKQVESKS